MRFIRAAWFLGVFCAIGTVASPADVPEARLGARVRVTTTQPAGRAGEQTFEGTLVSIETTAFSVGHGSSSEPTRVRRDDVTRIEMEVGRSRGDHAVIGALIGAAVGLAVAVVEHSRCEGEFMCGVEFGLPILTTPVGALVGAAVPGHRRWVEVAPPAAAVALRPAPRRAQVAWTVRF